MPGFAPSLGAPYRRRRRSGFGATLPATPAAPDTPSTPSPADTATAYYTLLSWVSARGANFDVYLDTVNPPATIVAPKIQATTYVPTLLPATTYYWKIAAFNAGGSAVGPVWAFTTPAATAVLFSLAGSIVTSRARFGSLSIHDAINAAPNTASMLFDTTAPTAGQAVKIGLGTLDAAALLFGGEIQSNDQSYVDTALATVYPANLIDYTFALNKRRPFGTWTNTSATTIAQSLVATFAPGFTSANVQGGLPTVSINFDGSADFMSCMSALAQAASTSTAPCYTYVDYARDLHLFNRAEIASVPNALSLTTPPLNNPSPIAFSTDLSQVRTRVYGKGNPQTTPTDVAVGETIVPITDASLFTTSGGKAIAGTIAGGAQTQIITYDGVQLGGGVSLVGPGAAPSVAPTLTGAAGSGLSDGVYQYAEVWVTAAGKTLPSPIASITLGGLATAPTIMGTAAEDPLQGFSSMTPGGTYSWVYTFKRNADGLETAPSPAATVTVTSPNPRAVCIDLSGCQAAPTGYTRTWYRTDAGGATYKVRNVTGAYIFQEAATFNARTNVFVDSAPDSSFGATMVGLAHQVAIGAGLGPADTTSREIYRTVANGSQLKLQQTIANNTATVGVQDATADASLGANAPVSDTSGLTQPTGQINAGSASVMTAGAASFQANGGWASDGSTVFRYTGISGNTLTGIPASGTGSLSATVLYNTQITAVPALTGVNAGNGVPMAMMKGSTVAIWVQRDDLSAQAALGLLELDTTGNPTDGIREYTITDGRMNDTGIAALCDADLALFSRPIVSATYYTRDKKSASGKTVAIDLVSGTFDPVTFDPATFDVAFGLGIAGTFVIQDVTISFDGPGLNPLYQVKAASVAFTLSDLLRRVALV